ncbi:MAG: hypothetical protein K2Y01_10185 [Rhabdochlamydiaceae bacterium]|nr:hypothetical protein [Rhabdochlamydiaceae bacterium]
MKTVFFLLGILALPLFGEESIKAAMESKKNTLQIDPALRAQDYQQAFEALRKEKPAHKVCITLQNGTIFSQIIEMQRMANSTLFLLRYNSPQGIKLQIVELESIINIGYLE